MEWIIKNGMGDFVEDALQYTSDRACSMIFKTKNAAVAEMESNPRFEEDGERVVKLDSLTSKDK
jgi:hypothetical protein